MEDDVLPPEKVAEAVRAFISNNVTLSVLHVLAKDALDPESPATHAENMTFRNFHEALDDLLTAAVGVDWEEKEAP